jgi:hypothetical protein
MFGPMAHADLLFLSSLDGELFDLRVIYLKRNPVDALLTSLNSYRADHPSLPSFKGHRYKARIAADCLMHLNNVLASAPCGRTLILKFEDFVAAPETYTESLAAILGLSADELAPSMFEAIQRSRHAAQHAPTIAQELTLFFKAQQMLWPLLATQEYFTATAR